MVVLQRFLCVTVLLLCFLWSAGGASGELRHYGSHNPLREAWSITGGDSGVAAAAIAPDPDYPIVSAWQINSSASGRLRYEIPGPGADDAWTYRVALRIVGLDQPADFGTVLEVANGERRFLLALGSGADGGLLVDVVEDGFPDSTDFSIAPLVGGQTAYHRIEITYAAGRAALFVDGVQLTDAIEGFAGTQRRVNFGDGANDGGTRARYADVRFMAGASACSDGIDNDGDGLVDYEGGDADCQSALDSSEGVYCPVGEDRNRDRICEEIHLQHFGDQDPREQGFVLSLGTGSGQSTAAGDDDYGAGACDVPCPYWRYTDAATNSGSLGNYRMLAFPSASPGGWAARAWVRTPPYEGESASASAPNVSRLMFLRFPGPSGTLEYLLSFGRDNDRQMLMNVLGASNVPSEPIGPVAAYHRVEVVYDPVTVTADVLVDGVRKVEALAPNLQLAAPGDWYLAFGSGSSAGVGRSHWHRVEFETNPDTDGDGVKDQVERDTLNTNPYLPDSDGDGLTDGAELVAGSDPLASDSDGDDLPDGYEVANGLDPTQPNADTDDDGDGLGYQREALAGTDPADPDSDDDGLSDGDEVDVYETQPLEADTDGDGLTDGDEVGVYGTDPLIADTDLDAILDGDEVLTLGTDPTDDDSDDDGLLDGQERDAGTLLLVADSDGDGLLDGLEVRYGFDPLVANAADGDLDGDGLRDTQEQAAGTRLDRADSDGDGLPDVDEVLVHGSNPNDPDGDGDGLLDAYEVGSGMNPSRADDSSRDADNDGLSAAQEQRFRTNALAPDTDGDGLNDGEEVNVYGSNPLVADRGPLAQSGYQTLRFVASNAPLFVDTPEPDFYPIELPAEANGQLTQGRVETVRTAIPLRAAQDAWDRAVNTCDARSERIPIYSRVDACRDLTVSPTRQECIDGGRISFASRSVQCCANAVTGVIDLLDDIGNGCAKTIFGTPLNVEKSFTVNDLNGLPGGPYVSPTYVDVGPGAGPRPTQAPAKRDYTVGAVFSGTTEVTAGFEVATQRTDPGSVDVRYKTEARHWLDRSAAAPGEAVQMHFEHRPRGFRSDFTPELSLRSRWPKTSLYAGYRVGLEASAQLEYWSIDPETGDQLNDTVDIVNIDTTEEGNFASFEFVADEKMELRFLQGVDYAPDEYQDLGFIVESDDLLIGSLIEYGSEIPIEINYPATCPIGFLAAVESTDPSKVKPDRCFGLPRSNPLQRNVAEIEFQVAELDTPVSADFNGGTEQPFSIDRIEPKRSELQFDGKLVNTIPNRFRPLINYTTDSDFAADPLSSIIDTFFMDNTTLSSDTSRWIADMDGMFFPIYPVVDGGVSLAGISLIEYELDPADFDVIVFVGWDQTLTFDPGLVAEVVFSQSVKVSVDGLPAQMVPAGVPVLVPMDTFGALSFEQPAGGVEIDVAYSFEGNVLDNDTKQSVTLAGQVSYWKASLGGIVGSLLETGLSAAVGQEFPLEFTALRYTLETPNLNGRQHGGSASLASSRLRFPGARLRVADSADDTDGDGLPDVLESGRCTDAVDADTDDDGLFDGLEDRNRNGLVDVGETDPCQADTDRDGLLDGFEMGLQNPTPATDLAVFVATDDPRRMTNALNRDSDDDGLADGDEIRLGADPLNADSDDDGIPDGEEIVQGTDPLSPDGLRGLNVPLIFEALKRRR